MVTIYLFGCRCGLNAHYIRKVQQSVNARVINTGIDKAKLKEHVKYLKKIGITKTYTPIVVDGEIITELSKWTSQPLS